MEPVPTFIPGMNVTIQPPASPHADTPDQRRAIARLGFGARFVRRECKCGIVWAEPVDPNTTDGRDKTHFFVSTEPCPGCEGVYRQANKHQITEVDPTARQGYEGYTAAIVEVGRFRESYPFLARALDPAIAKALGTLQAPPAMRIDLGRIFRVDTMTDYPLWPILERHGAVAGVAPAPAADREYIRLLGSYATSVERTALALAEGAGVVESRHELEPAKGPEPWVVTVRTAIRPNRGNFTFLRVSGARCMRRAPGGVEPTIAWSTF